MFKGSFVALVTPYHFETAAVIDENALENLVLWHKQEGTHGLVIGGSTGEGSLLTAEEHEHALRICTKTAAGQMPIIANISSIRLQDVLALAAQAEAIPGVQGLMLTPPPYVKPTQEGLYRFMAHVHDATRLPLIIYNNPGRCGVTIDQKTQVEIAQLPRVVAFKDSTGDLKTLPEQRDLMPSRITHLCGEDQLNAAFLAQGGHGWISVTANVAPQLSAQLYQAWQDQNLEKFHHLRDTLAPLYKALGQETNPVTIKYAVSRLGLCRDSVRLPLVPATEKSRQLIDQALKKLKLIGSTS